MAWGSAESDMLFDIEGHDPGKIVRSSPTVNGGRKCKQTEGTTGCGVCLGLLKPVPTRTVIFAFTPPHVPHHPQSKPKGRLKAHDGYSFFIKFYLATVVLLGVMATLFIVGSTNFAKECSLQVTHRT